MVASTLGKLCYTSTGVASKIPDVIRLAGGMRALVDLMVTSDVDAELRPVVCETVILALKMLCDNSMCPRLCPFSVCFCQTRS